MILLVAAMQRVLDELAAILEQVGAELPARARQIVQRVEVELAGQLSDYTASLTWLACVGRGVKSLLRFRLTDNSSGRR
jgi:hypothetical protein